MNIKIGDFSLFKPAYNMMVINKEGNIFYWEIEQPFHSTQQEKPESHRQGEESLAIYTLI